MYVFALSNFKVPTPPLSLPSMPPFVHPIHNLHLQDLMLKIEKLPPISPNIGEKIGVRISIVYLQSS
jgi:hypothetical protein